MKPDINSNTELIMQFDPNTIDHLGIKMYSTLPPVIAEIIANSYDAEATKVEIRLFDSDTAKKIIIEDNGLGMSFDEINKDFLPIGRNRRIINDSQKSKNNKRLVIGKKGIGKLSFFGISKLIQIETIQNSTKNAFILNWDELKKSGESFNDDGLYKPYKPKIISKNESVQLINGTKVSLFNIERKSPFFPEEVAYSLSRYFQVFDEKDFQVSIYHNYEEIAINITNDLKYSKMVIDHTWEFPLKESEQPKKKYYMADVITGKVILSKDTVPSDMQGIALFSRNKLVNEAEFYGVKATSHGYSYLTGNLNVDFIDMFAEDVISTNRRSLIWEYEETRELREYLDQIIRNIFNDAKKIKEQKKIEEIEEVTGIEIDSWIDELPSHEKKLARKLVTSIVSSEGIGTNKAGELVLYVKDSFQFESFKQIARDFQEIDDLSGNQILDLFKEWELIEAREMYKLATGRVETIKTFEKLIDDNAKEVEQIHPFFEKFPWILDLRINMFKHEVQYVKLLREKYPEAKLKEKNRRIDFLCTSVSNHRFIIELKRPHHKINKDDIDQAKDYRSFVQEYSNTTIQSPNRVIAYIVGGKLSDDRITLDELESTQNADKVYAKTYSQLLTDAQNHHSEFIERYNKMIKKSG